MSKIIITTSPSTQSLANRLYLSLQARFDKNVALGFDAFISPNGNREMQIAQLIADTTALLILIGDDWLADGWINDENHPLRLAIRHATAQQKRIIVIVCENASMPSVKDLPMIYVPIFLENVPLPLRSAYYDENLRRIINTIMDAVSIQASRVDESGSPIPTHVRIQLELANRWRRFLAYILDLIFLYGLIFMLATAVASQYNRLLTRSEYQRFTDTLELVVFTLTAAYFIVSTATGGQTFGKMVMKIQVIRTSGAKVGWIASIRRYSIIAISSIAFLLDWQAIYSLFVIIGFLGYVVIFFDNRRQGWHDKLANTVVINKKG